jgi:rfaE bifunctional protein nucleotidyltransferase chain/domain
VVTPNLAEAQHAAAGGHGVGASSRAATTLPDVIALGVALRERWRAGGLAVTLGRRGALLIGADGTPLVVPARPLDGQVDACGAGDRFAASVAGAIADGTVLSEAVIAGVEAATTFVAAGGAGTRDAWSGSPPSSPDNAAADIDGLLTAVRARGGTVVATGGCFDLLHAGHARLLSEARALGDCLVVCLNSDASVARLKGPGRPVLSADDRRAMLLALTAVDAVVVFDEDIPTRALRRLRPDIWVKGADYAVADLPEATDLQSWGGHAVVLPYLDGRSTTAMIQEATRHARR